ncbi:hypothetical protein FISHEDRAFT_47082 [Fistulina hepatica ATCC 64428]|uniref:Xylanolytic transcriptional activator regulatory domain-containing protein n=1 Tax=Fistulina hepatica ATCC 64428 TaxID=1128425 RepID=A0A0D7A6B7_9AGAR|nr:hypothetical protein FISHEDRAFT_47082 [Fistulina hepatica ATCC 64428]
MISESAHWHFVFPEYSLMGTLIALYFKHINTSVPILHRPTFETNVGEGLHLRDRYFGAVVLLVCALGSRYTDDPRTLPEGYPNRHAAGYMWFEQVPWLRKSLLESPCLYEVQLYALASFYLLSTSSPQAAWTTCGVALRFCQALGVHRKNSRRKAADGQHWKRVFWSLIIADRIYSSFMGRACCIQSEDIDIDLPAECDDEYWDTGDPSTSFKQPPGKPSQMAYMTCLAQLSEILAFALRNLYSTKKYLTLVGHTGPDWERQMVSDLDSALNKWLDSVPDFLRWDPNREDPQFFEQSCSLYCIFYHTQIQIHRQFISKKSPLMFTSLAICTNAARSCSRLFSLMIRRGAIVSIPQHMILAFTAGVVLLMNIWGGKKTGLVNDPVHEMSDVQACLDFLKIMESGFSIILCPSIESVVADLDYCHSDG